MTIENTEYTIRPVKITDLDQLFAMLIELVSHEGLTERFQLTRERLENELFGINADWHCLTAIASNDSFAGFCLYSFANINRAFNRGSMIHIDDLYVTPSYRKAGIGYRLIQELALIAKTKGITRLNVWCVKDNEQAQKFYKKIGGEKLDFLDVYAINVDS